MTPPSTSSTRDPESSAAGATVRARGWGWRHAGRLDWAVRDLDLDIEAGERILLLGASGSGKSTLLHALAGVLGGDDEGEQQGSLVIDGEEPAQRRGTVGLVLQDPDSQVIMSKVGDDVAFGCENLGVAPDEIWRRVAHAVDAVGLDVALDRPTERLSGGQKQRLALAGVVAMRPRMVLLDEPTANLDPDGVADVRDAVGRVLDTTGATLVVVEHRIDVWLPLITRVVVLDDDGGILADGPPDVVLTRRETELTAAGVWVPGRRPAVVDRRTDASGETLLTAESLAVARVRAGRTRARKRGQKASAADQAVGDGIVRRDIDLAVTAGEALAITGPNGSGKSTLGLTLAGLLAPADGRVHASEALAGGVGPHPFRWKSRHLLTRIGTVFQDPEHQFLTATVRRELELGPRTLGLTPAETDARVDELLQRLRLDHLADANPFTLSGGQKRRLSVATALATRPRVLVLDEPTFGQDARTWRELVDLLGELLDHGSALVAMTHDADFVRVLATREHRFAAASGAVTETAPDPAEVTG